MEITNVEAFLKYYSRIKSRTQKLFEYIPPEKIEWTYQEGKFTIGDIIRHLAVLEREMYAENAQFKPSVYKGCGIEYAEGYEQVIALYNNLYQESLATFSKLTMEDMNKKCKTPAGIPITLWKWLRAMIEHEVHHRSQIYIYLGMLNIKTPPIFGLTSEEVASKSK
ncbi:MAG: DinB family protein [Aureispira sp.]|nr:DinB family protein [Aureispira sp.]